VRILFVAMADSVHAARWIDQVTGCGWDLHVVPVDDGPLHPALHDVTVHERFARRAPSGSVRVRGFPMPWPRGAVELRRRLAKRRPDWRAEHLAGVVRRLRPNLVHSLEIQHAAYLTYEARTRLGGEFPPWIVSNWGSDIYVFGRLAEHRERIRAVLAACDYYGCECERDVGLARRLGFGGEALPVLPNAGGYELARLRALRAPGPTSRRDLVVLKGYQTWAGRSLFGLRAIELCADALAGRRVAIFSAGPDVALAARLVAERTGVPIEALPQLPHEEILRLHGRARVSIGLSIGDAISTSLLEAMVMGSFPIQSHTACADEWIEDGKSGLLVHPEDVEGIALALRRALADDALVDAASETNARTAEACLERGHVSQRVRSTYARIGRVAVPSGAGYGASR
jgi:glycosyltransferase involved in cell wall biosynthesis